MAEVDVGSRIDRLEGHLERMDQKLDILVRLEERQVNHDESLRRVYGRVEAIESRVRAVEIQGSSEKSKSGGNEYLVRMLIGLVFGVMSAMVVWVLK